MARYFQFLIINSESSIFFNFLSFSQQPNRALEDLNNVLFRALERSLSQSSLFFRFPLLATRKNVYYDETQRQNIILSLIVAKL